MSFKTEERFYLKALSQPKKLYNNNIYLFGHTIVHEPHFGNYCTNIFCKEFGPSMSFCRCAPLFKSERQPLDDPFRLGVQWEHEPTGCEAHKVFRLGIFSSTVVKRKTDAGVLRKGSRRRTSDVKDSFLLRGSNYES